jgi:putative addiction module component (TIGR02574 family)
MLNRFEVPIAQLSFTQKLDLMETLWTDMIGNEKKLESPAWHEAILNDREAALNAGTITTSSWEEAKERIKNNVA